MRLSRLLPVLAVGALTVASVTPAAAAEPGVGSTTGTLTVLGLDAGSVLDLEILSDIGGAVTDPDAGTPSAAAALSALRSSSDLLGLAHEVPLLEAQSTGAEQTASQDTTALPANPLVDGDLLPASLSALVGETGALSTIGAGIADLDVLGGLLGVSSSELGLGANALTTQADGSRTLSLDGLTVLDLDALLAGLGIPLTDLPLDTVLGLVDSLGLTDQLSALLADLGINDVLADLGLDLLDLDDLSVERITGLVTDLPALLTGGTGTSVGELCTLVEDTSGGLLDGLGDVVGGLIEVCEDVGGAVDDLVSLDDVTALVDGLLGELLGTVLGVLEGTTLLSLDGLDVTVLTTATDALETSVADVTATLGGLTVGDIGLGDLDVLAPVGDVSGVLSQVESLLGDVLGQVSPLLEDLISVDVLEETTSVSEDSGAITALASFTGLEIGLAPVDVGALLASLSGGLTIGDQLTDLGLPLPDLSPILGINDLLDAAAPVTDLVTALSGGATMQIASLSQQSTYEVLSTSTPAPAPAPTPAAPATPAAPGAPSLPKTGGDAGWLLFAGLAAVGALGLRRAVRAER